MPRRVGPPPTTILPSHGHAIVKEIHEPEKKVTVMFGNDTPFVFDEIFIMTNYETYISC